LDQAELAALASVSRNTILEFEKGRRQPSINNLAAICSARESAGVEFTNGDAPGVRLRKGCKR
jgi:transcriptional regulator with XRE-family HTH domain